MTQDNGSLTQTACLEGSSVCASPKQQITWQEMLSPPGPRSHVLLEKWKRDRTYPTQGRHGLFKKHFDVIQAAWQGGVETEKTLLRQGFCLFIWIHGCFIKSKYWIIQRCLCKAHLLYTSILYLWNNAKVKPRNMEPTGTLQPWRSQHWSSRLNGACLFSMER